jgi:putative oxidoreductase
MKITSIFSRYLLGLIFTVFGLNGFLNFIHQPPPANPLAIQFLVSVSESHFAAFFLAIQLLGGLLLLSGYFVPLALTVLAAELYNILAFHLTLAPASIAPALVASLLWVLVFVQYRESFKGIFRAEARDAVMNWVVASFASTRSFSNRLKLPGPWRPAFRSGVYNRFPVARAKRGAGGGTLTRIERLGSTAR